MDEVNLRVLYDKGNDRKYVIIPKKLTIPVGSYVRITPLWVAGEENKCTK